jgi:ABC-type sugar transport system ATPase subunit
LNNYESHRGKLFIHWKKIYSETEKLLAEFNILISPNTLVEELSIGFRQLIEILKAVACNAKLIVMDEPSATLSKDEFKALLQIINTLKSREITIVYISHRLEELFIVGDSITVLRDGKHVFTGTIGNIDQKMLVKLMVGHELTQFMRKMTKSCNEEILNLRSLSTEKITDINLRVEKSEIHGLYGLVGSGRTELLNAIYGIDTIRSGSVRLRGREIRIHHPSYAIRLGIGLLPENRKTQGLVLGLPVWENVSMAGIHKFLKFGMINYAAIFAQTKNYVDRLSIKTPGIAIPVSDLSGGNQQKVVISKWLIKDCDLLLVDEPTQGIDVSAKAEIYTILENLSELGKTILIVSSELEELLSVASSISVMYEGRLIKTFYSNELEIDKIQQCALTGRIE